MENSQWLAGIRHFFSVALSSADLAPCWGSALILGCGSALIKIHGEVITLDIQVCFLACLESDFIVCPVSLGVFDSNHYGPFFSIIIASFYCIEKDITAACFIMIGTFVKLYGIVGLAFFFFQAQG